MAKRRLIRKDKRPIKQSLEHPRIPGGITPEHFMEIQRILDIILGDIAKELGKSVPKELHIRLNESQKPFPLPLFAGWVEAKDVKETREKWNHPHPGLHRFADDVYSEVYGKALHYANETGEAQFQFRNWASDEIREKRAGEKATDPKAGNCYQTCLAIVVKVRVKDRNQLRAVGTLVLGFQKEPNSLTAAHRIMRQWAREPDTTPDRCLLIDFLKMFDLGGPLVGDKWWDRI